MAHPLRALLLVVPAALALAGCGADDGDAAAPCPPAAGAEERRTTFPEAPPMCIDPAKTYVAQISTDAGDIEIALDPAKAPKTVNNFVYLARYRYYDGVTFHRVVKDFMVQTGDPASTRDDSGDHPGYTFADELPSSASDYTPGTVAMANRGADTNGGQFFIMTREGLDPAYSIFGEVTSGMETVSAIEADGGTSDAGIPDTIHTITSVTITEKD